MHFPSAARLTQLPLLAAILLLVVPNTADQKVVFIPYTDARPILEAMADALPPALKGLPADKLAKAWPSWVSWRDAEIRSRLERGDEDSVINFLLFGTSFARQARLTPEFIRQFGQASNQTPAGSAPDSVRLLRFAEAREVIASFQAVEPSGNYPRNAPAWDSWIHKQDAEIRRRVDRGIEDSVSNLILYGTSYTSLPRLESFESVASPRGELTRAARARVHALAASVGSPGDNERVRFVRDFLRRRGITNPLVEKYLSGNLRRFLLEQRSYQEKLSEAGATGDPAAVLLTRGTLFEKRGLSVDTSLLPNLALEETLRSLVAKEVLASGRMRRVAVIGPGLDFADKLEGFDFYPLQTTQPFAVLESVMRLGLANPDGVQIATLDLNAAVNSHVRRLAERGRAGQAYLIQLPRDTAAGWNSQAESYWEHFGETVGSPAPPLAVPPALTGVVSRAVSIRPAYAGRAEALDLDVVAQTIDVIPGEGFDLVVATNVLVYYDRFEQALAMASIAHMLNPGGVFLANHVLPAQHPQALEYLGRRSISYSASGQYGDDVVVYRRR